MSETAKAELEAINQIHAVLEPFDGESQKRVLEHVLGLVGLATTRLRRRAKAPSKGEHRRTRSTGKRRR